MTTSREEWARSWALPFVAGLGMTGANLFPFVSSLLLLPLTSRFGWTRAQFSLGMLLQIPISLVAVPYFAMLVDRHGPRRVLLCGIPVAACGYAMMALVGPSIHLWWSLVALLGLTMAPVLPVAWIAAVIARFDTSRGLALAIALAGVGVGAAIWPVLGALAMRTLGWRAALPALGTAWALVLFPLAYATLPRERRQSEPRTAPTADSPPIGLALRSKVFLLLICAGSLFIAAIHGLNLNLVPILSGLGYALPQAASIAGLAGLGAIGGRIVTGTLLDHLPTRPLAIGMFLLPLVTLALFLDATSGSRTLVFAVALLGFSLGSESDIIAYIASRRIDPRVFAFTYSIATAVFGMCSALGPFLANRLFDSFHSYHPFYWAVIPAILLGTALIALVPMNDERRAPV